MLKKMIPECAYHSILDVPYEKLYNDGIRLLLTDLDNTLVDYNTTEPTESIIAWAKKVQDMGFELIIVSNSRKSRAPHFAQKLGIKVVKMSLKPLLKGAKKALKIASRKYERNEVFFTGDQIMTDIICANRMKFHSCFIEPVDKSTDKWPTRLNRKFERFFVKRIAKKYPEIYKNRMKDYGL